MLGLAGWKLFWCRPIEAPYTKAVGNLFLLLSLSALLALAFGTVAFEGEPVRAGGATGELLAGLLVADFGRTGAYIVVATALFVSLILSTQFSFSALLKGTSGRVGERLRALRTAFTHYRESRRKEKLRREVIRKHAAAREGALGAAAHRARQGRRTTASPRPRRPTTLPSAEDDLPLQAAAIAARRRAEAAALRRRAARRRAVRSAAERDPARALAAPPHGPRAGSGREPRRAAASRCPRSRSWTRPRAAPSSTTTGCSSAARSCSSSRPSSA